MYYLCQNFNTMKNIIYTPFIKSNKNDFPEITPRGYKRHYTSYDVDDTEEATIVAEPENLEIDFSLPDINYKFTDKESFKTRMLKEYTSALEARGINPEFAKYLVAQDALESGWGSKPSGLYNYGNITGKSGKTLTVPEFIDGKWENINQTFKNYSNIRRYINDKIDLLSKKRYDVFNHPITEFVSRIVSGGYATAPNYADVLNRVIASMRKGGILKFEKGGKEYLENNREHYNQQIGFNSFLPIGNIPYRNVTSKVDNVTIVDYPPKHLEDSWDNYHGAINMGSQVIHVNKNSDKRDITVNHEVGHLIVAPIIKNIEKLIKKWDGKIFINDNIEMDSYIDSAKEIGARMYSYLMDSGYRGNVSSADTLSFVNSERDRFTSEYLADIIDKGNRTRSKHDSSGNITFIVNSNSRPGLESRVIREYNDPYNIYDRYNDAFIYDLIKLFYATNDSVQKGRLGMVIKKYQNGGYIPTIDDLVDFTASYEGFKAFPYILKTSNGVPQTLIGHGIADADLIEKYKDVGIPEDVSKGWIKDRLVTLDEYFSKTIKNYKNLPINIRLGILDSAYNTTDINFFSNSKKLRSLIENGETNPEVLVTEMDHSKTAGGWLGVRSAARRAMALGKYNWQWESKDKYGRHLDPNIPVGIHDYKASPYYNKY